MGFDIGSYYEARAPFDEEGGELYHATTLVKALFRKHLGSTTKFLDVGCGVGNGTLSVAQALVAEEIFGVDFTPSYLEAARGKGIQTFQVDLNSSPLPFDSESFDAILCSEVIGHLVDSDNLLREIYRVLTPQGVCVLTTPNLASWLDRIALFFFGWQPFSTSTAFNFDVGRPKFLTNRTTGKHIRVLTYRALRELLQAYDFRVLEAKVARGFTDMSFARVAHGTGFYRSILYVVKLLLLLVCWPVDWAASHVPWLAMGIVIAAKKKSS